MPALKHIQTLRAALPWIQTPLVISAPMKNIAGPELAVATSEAGGIGFVGPWNQPGDLAHRLKESSELVQQSKVLSSFIQKPATPSRPEILPIGVGIQTWTGDLRITSEILLSVAPAVVWLFAPRHGQAELDEWTRGIRQSSPQTRVWIQVGSVAEARAAAESNNRPDVLIVQGADAGGHSRTRGAGIVTLLPEVVDALEPSTDIEIPLIAAGGIADARGFAAALVLGASGVAMGTRFLASREAIINPGYQRHVLAGSDGGQTTVKTQLYNHLRGTMGWPEEFNARGIVNQTWRDHEQGMAFEVNKEMYEADMKKGEAGWGENGRMATYAGTGIGLVKELKSAGEIVREVRGGIEGILQATTSALKP
ncbi:hypothetical protein BP6252_05872 [Coleophoma cylindrospora]|uniref:Uncharacterized protein n=1 Tax=Coleophoma cylindrospora TaxID=1849047 RepID=A0A3D8RUR8_9HELO|nr:hypothetical protein BP6252_05872 [Coleophoma cylindrospora]